MSEFTVDFSQVQDYEILPEGVYEIEVTEARVTKSKAGDAMLALKVAVLDGEYEGRALYPNLMLVGRGLGITKAAFTAMGLPGGKMDIDDLIGATSTVRITQHVYKVEDGGDGKARNNVGSWINPSAM